MLLAELVAASKRVAETRARSRKIGILKASLESVPPGELALAVSLLSGELPAGRVGLGYATVFGVEAPPAGAPSLTLSDVERRLAELAGLSGAGSASRRRELLGAFYARATAEEQDFLKRLLVGELRQGALGGVLKEAIAAAFHVPGELVRRAAMLEGDLARVAVAAARDGRAGLERFHLELFKPLEPMLAQTASDTAEALGQLGTARFEYKLDGARIQVHKAGDVVRVYTRNLNEVTSRVPDIVERVRALPAETLVLDGEALSLRADGRPQPFQVTMRRFGKKLDDERLRRELPLSPFFFDLLHADGADLIDEGTGARGEALAALVPIAERVPALSTADPAQAQQFLRAALEAGHEGLMAKAEQASYEAGRRGMGWLKVKPAHTLDLVVLAVEWGSGRRRGYLSNLHLGARDPRDGSFVMLGKTFKGMTDAMLAFQTKELLLRETARDGHVVHVRPELVVEVAFDGVQTSSQYPGGVALRFARIKGYRLDKRADEADTIDTVRALAHGGVEHGVVK